MELRWGSPPEIPEGQHLSRFWCHRLATSRDLLFILGRGFDPRMLDGLRILKCAGGSGRRDVDVLEFERNAPTAHEDLVKENLSKLEELVRGWGVLREVRVDMVDKDGQYVGPRRVGGNYTIESIRSYSDVIVDISAISRGLYFPLIGRILRLLDREQIATNLHVLVSENPDIDRLIVQEGSEPDWVHGFTGGFSKESQARIPRLWAPVLGEGQTERLKALLGLIQPVEVCPVVPFPSRDPRRGDRIVLEYSRHLFKTGAADPSNIIYASEWNPFDVYRRIKRLHVDYGDVLAPLGGAKTAVSALSSKLISVGALLSAYDEDHIGIAHVRSSSHRIEDVTRALLARPSSTVYSIWLTGEPYEP